MKVTFAIYISMLATVFISCKTTKRDRSLSEGELQSPPAATQFDAPIEGTNLVGKVEEIDGSLQMVGLHASKSPPPPPTLGDLTLTMSPLQTDSGGSYPVVSFTKRPSTAYVEYKVCQGSNCIDDFTNSDNLVIFDLPDPNKSATISLRACNESNLSPSVESCTPWSKPTGTFAQLSVTPMNNQKMHALLVKTGDTKRSLKFNGLTFLSNRKRDESTNSSDPSLDLALTGFGNHMLAEGLVVNAIVKANQSAKASTTLNLTSDVSDTVCFNRDDYKELDSEKQCYLDRRISTHPILKLKEELFWNDAGILCQSWPCIDVINCVLKLNIDIYLVFAGHRCISNSERRADIGTGIGISVALGVVGIGATVAGAYLNDTGDPVKGKGLMILGGAFLAGAVVAGTIYGLKADGYMLTTAPSVQKKLLNIITTQNGELVSVLQKILVEIKK